MSGYRLTIKFPFQSVNDEQYVLALHARAEGLATSVLATAFNAMLEERMFKFIKTYTVGDDRGDEFEGTLCGGVKAEDDDRDDMFEPLCSSKLKFNIACERFPSWLMDMCGYATDVRVVLYVVTTNAQTPLRVRWRGYLQCNTLNMTVVDDLLACPVVAVDEIGVAKYLPFRANCAGRPGRLSLYEVFKTWWSMNWSLFEYAYTDLGLATNQAALYFSRNVAVLDYHGDQNRNVLADVYINLERYYLDRDASWKNVFEDVCRYVGVHFSIGAYGTNYSYDNYIVAAYDDDNSGNMSNYAYTLATNATFVFNDAKYAVFGNQAKVGGDLQVTYEPDKFKGVQITSIPERPPVHEYLSKDNVKDITPAAGHYPCVQCRIGQYKAGQFSEILEYWRLIYTEIVSKQDQWTEEADYIELEDCTVSDAGRSVGGSGYFPMTDAPLGRNKPSGEDTDSLEFIVEKRGMIPVKIGNMDHILPNWPQKMFNYLMLLNNVWGRLYWDNDEAFETDTTTPYKVATIYPFGKDTSIISTALSYLAIDFSAMVLNENIGTGDDIIETTGIGLGEFTGYRDLYGRASAVFPMTKTFHVYSYDSDNITAQLVDDPGNNQHVVHFAPFLTVRLRIGNWFYYYDWDDADNRGWTYYDDPDDAPTFMLPLIGSAQNRWSNLTGISNTVVTNYYYNELHPASRVIDPVFYVPLDGVSDNTHPLEGRVSLEIWWPTPYLNYYKAVGGVKKYNNILSILISDIDIRFTDDSEISGTDIELMETTETDPSSDTKELKVVALELASPKVDGVFNNCLLYNNGLVWKNLQTVNLQTTNATTTLEKSLANMMADVYRRPQVWVELRRKFNADDYADIANLDFRVHSLSEAAGTFVPVKRSFDFIKGWAKWKLQKLTDDLPPTRPYLTFTAETAGATVQLNKVGNDASSLTATLQVSTDGGYTWNDYHWTGNDGDVITLANVGDTVKFKGTNAQFSLSFNAYYKFTISGDVSASGDVTSLLSTSCGDVALTSYCFCYLFSQTHILTSPNLPSTTLNTYCYFGTFYGCNRMTTSSELPATDMFIACYQYMYNGCSALASDQVLTATVLANACYAYMYNGCGLIDSVELHATDISATNCLNTWLGNVAASGTLKCDASLTLPDGASGIPSGWTRVNL